jgi:hypothetical protein
MKTGLFISVMACVGFAFGQDPAIPSAARAYSGGRECAGIEALVVVPVQQN